MKKCVKDLIAGAVLALCSIGYYIASHSIQSFGSNKDFISARTIPVAWAVLLLVLSVVMMVRSYAEIRHLKATGEEIFSGRTPKDWLADNYAVIGTFIILFLYAFAMRLSFRCFRTTCLLSCCLSRCLPASSASEKGETINVFGRIPLGHYRP